VEFFEKKFKFFARGGQFFKKEIFKIQMKFCLSFSQGKIK
jgi:hypothetical protein